MRSTNHLWRREGLVLLCGLQPCQQRVFVGVWEWVKTTTKKNNTCLSYSQVKAVYMLEFFTPNEIENAALKLQLSLLPAAHSSA